MRFHCIPILIFSPSYLFWLFGLLCVCAHSAYQRYSPATHGPRPIYHTCTALIFKVLHNAFRFDAEYRCIHLPLLAATAPAATALCRGARSARRLRLVRGARTRLAEYSDMSKALRPKGVVVADSKSWRFSQLCESLLNAALIPSVLQLFPAPTSAAAPDSSESSDIKGAVAVAAADSASDSSASSSSSSKPDETVNLLAGYALQLLLGVLLTLPALLPALTEHKQLERFMQTALLKLTHSNTRLQAAIAVGFCLHLNLPCIASSSF